MSSKQREELQRISAAITVNTLPNGVRTIVCKMSQEEVKHIVDTILAEPLRNCDVGSAEEQYERWLRYCVCFKSCVNCPLKGEYSSVKCYAKWSQLPYEHIKTNKTKTNKGE